MDSAWDGACDRALEDARAAELTGAPKTPGGGHRAKARFGAIKSETGPRNHSYRRLKARRQINPSCTVIIASDQSG
jgi:hypothetical protein